MKFSANQNRNGTILLALASIIWGSSFVPQRVAMQHMHPFTFTATRFLLGAITLLPLLLFLNHDKSKNPDNPSKKTDQKMYLKAGLLCGGLLFMAVSFQQYGMQTTEAGKAGFLSSMYVVMVPLLGFFIGKRVRKAVWLGVLLAVAGVYLLSFTNQLRIERGDLIVLMGTVFWAAHILMLDRFLPEVDGLSLAIMQFLVGIRYCLSHPFSQRSQKRTRYQIVSTSALFNQWSFRHDDPQPTDPRSKRNCSRVIQQARDQGEVSAHPRRRYRRIYTECFTVYL